MLQLLNYNCMKPFLSKLDMMSLKKLWRKLGHYIYRKSDDKFYMNDVPNDVIGNYPGFEGCMGYICEYDG